MTKIKNLVFDIGGVLLHWRPTKIIKDFNQQHPEISVEMLEKVFSSPKWQDLNRGKINEERAIEQYSEEFSLDKKLLIELMQKVKKSLTPIDGSFQLLQDIYDENIPTYCITDNVDEIITYLKDNYNDQIFSKFKGITISTEAKMLKSDDETNIYQYFLNNYNLVAEECVFIDDLPKNLDNAKKNGMNTILFTDAQDCREQLKKYGIKI